jgi:membrane protein YdbS with pleckstrin-like domain
MKTKILKPSPKYATKLRVGLTLLTLVILTCILLLSVVIGLDKGVGIGSLAIIFLIASLLSLLCWVSAMFMAGAYYRSLSYEIQDDEVIVRVGIITQSVKHVPYRTVTNLTVNRDPLDRWFFDLGALKIQTAGMSGQTGAEENLLGLPNSQEVYELVADELRRFRGAMPPTQAGEEADLAPAPDAVLDALLDEVRAIRRAVEQS